MTATLATLPLLLLIACAGGVGCAARVIARDLWMRRGQSGWSAVLKINLLGGCAMGVVAAWSVAHPNALASSLAVGFLGGWTTYSAFATDLVQLWLRGRRVVAIALWTATLLGTPCGLWLGFAGWSLLQPQSAGGAP